MKALFRKKTNAIPQKLAMQSEAIADLKHAIVRTVEGLVHETLCDWEG